MKLNKLNPLQLFILAFGVAGILLALDTYISNRLATNIERIYSTIAWACLSIPLFITGARASIKLNYSAWAAFNIFAVIAIIGWSIWISLMLFVFNNIQLTFPS